MGAVATDRLHENGLNYEFTQYSMIKVPRRGSMYVKDYYNNRWRLVRVWDILKKQVSDVCVSGLNFFSPHTCCRRKQRFYVWAPHLN